MTDCLFRGKPARVIGRVYSSFEFPRYLILQDGKTYTTKSLELPMASIGIPPCERAGDSVKTITRPSAL